MIIAVDARLPDSGAGGVQNVILSLIQGANLIEDNSIKFIWVIYKDSNWLKDVYIKNPNFIIDSNPIIKLTKKLDKKIISLLTPIYMLISHRKKSFDKQFSKLEVDIVILPFQNSLNTSLPYIYFPHDFLHKIYPKYFTFLQRLVRNYVWKQKAIKAQKVICETPLIKENIKEYWGISESKIEIVVTPPNKSKNKSNTNLTAINSDYLFYPAAYWPHKNHKTLIEAFKILAQKEVNIKLILTGSGTNNLKLPIDLQKSKRILIYEHVDRDVFEKLLLNCSGVIVPSLYESLSLVIFEALILQKPVFCSDIWQFRLQTHNNSIFFNPLSSHEIAVKIEEFVESKHEKFSYYYENNDILLKLFAKSIISICFEVKGNFNYLSYKDERDYMKNPSNFFKRFS